MARHEEVVRDIAYKTEQPGVPLIKIGSACTVEPDKARKTILHAVENPARDLVLGGQPRRCDKCPDAPIGTFRYCAICRQAKEPT